MCPQNKKSPKDPLGSPPVLPTGPKAIAFTYPVARPTPSTSEFGNFPNQGVTTHSFA